MKVLALDLGTRCGFAVGDVFSPGRVLSGTMNFKPGKFASFGRRAKDFGAWLDRIYTLEDFGDVVFEEVRRHVGTDAAHIYGSFLAEVTSFCEDNAIPCAGVPVGTIKKHATGRGNAKKPEMMAAAVSWGFKPDDDNEADALALLRLRLEQLQPKGIFA